MKLFFRFQSLVLFVFLLTCSGLLFSGTKKPALAVANERQLYISLLKNSAVMYSPNGDGNETILILDSLTKQWKTPSVENKSLSVLKESRSSGSFSVAVDGNRAVIGMPWANSYRGEIIILKRVGNYWTQEQRIVPPDISKNDHFGLSVDISGDVVAVSASWQNRLSGSVYLYKLSSGEWKQIQKISGTSPAPGEYFGNGISLKKNTLDVSGGNEVYQYSLSDYSFNKTERNKEEGTVSSAQPRVPASVHSLLELLGTFTAPNWGNAVLFDGVDDYAELYDYFSNNEMTLEFWVKPLTLPGAGQSAPMIERRGSVANQNENKGFLLSLENKENGEGIRFVTLPGEGLFVPYSLQINRWYHVACTIDASTISLYVNGVLIGSAPNSPVFENNAGTIVLAKDMDGNMFNGMIDEVQFWSNARTENEITGDMLTPLLSPWDYSSLLSYWQLDFGWDDGGVTYLYDSKSGIFGTLFNGVQFVVSDLGTPIQTVQRVTATSGSFEDRVVIQWSRIPNDNLLYEIFRDGMLLSVVSSEDSVFTDYTGTRSIEYTYCVYVLGPEGFLSAGRCTTGKSIVFAPTSFQASFNEFTDGIELTWARSSNVAARQVLYRDGSFLADLANNVSRYFDTSASPGVEHIYTIAAKDSIDIYSEWVQATGKRAYVLPPTNFSATDGTYPDRVILTWTNPAQPIYDHWIFRDGNVLQDHVPAGDTMFIDFTAAPGVKYTYCMWSSDGAHESKFVCDEGGIGILPAPANVVVSDSLFDDKITITWEDTSHLEDNFIVQRSDGKRDTVAANTTSFTDKTALPGVEYLYCLAAISTKGGRSQDVCDYGTRAIVLAPDTLLASDGLFENRTVLAWSSKSTKGVLFKIYRDGKQIATRSGTTRTYEDVTTVANKKYDYAISAMDAQGHESRKIHATGGRALRAPSDLTITKGAFEDRIVLTWKDNSGFEKAYRIRREFFGDIVTIAEIEPNRTSYTDSMYYSVSGHVYLYYVDAYDYDPNDHSDERVSYGYSDADSGLGSFRLRPVGNVQATDGLYEDKVVITWEDSSQVESGFFIYRNGESFPFVTVGSNQTSFIDNVPAFGQQNTYEVAAYRNYYENISEKKSDVGSTILFPPTSINVSNNYSNKVTVSVIDGSKAPNHKVQVFRDGVMLAEGASSLYFSDSTSANPGTQTYSAKTVAEDGVTASTEVSATGGIGPVETLTNLLTGTTPASNGQFGYSVAIDRDYAIIGHGGSKLVSFFQKIGGVWKHMQTYSGRSSVASFGQAVSIYSDYAVVGAPLSDYIYIFKRNGDGTWSEIKNLLGPVNGLHFGASVAINDDRIIVGAPYQASGGAEAGGVYIYEYSTYSNSLTLITNYFTNAPYGHWGSSVSVQPYAYALGFDWWDIIGVGGPEWGATVMIHQVRISFLKQGEEKSAENMPENKSVMLDFSSVSENEYGQKTQKVMGDLIYYLLGDEGESKFGTSVSVSGTKVAIGSPKLYNRGSVRMFHYVVSTGYVEDDPVYGYGEVGNGFGRSVSLNSNKLLVGGGHYNNQSIATLYTWDGTRFRDSLVFIGGSGVNAVGFGNSVGLTSTGVIIGVPNESSTQTNGGGAYIYNWNSVNSNVAEVATFKASDGTFRDRVQLDWTISGSAPSGFRIYRDTTLIATMAGSDVSYSDLESEPGKISSYQIAAFSTANGESRRVANLGWRPADGTISGRVANGAGTGVESVKVCLDPVPLKSLHFDGTRGAIDLGNPADLNFRGIITIESWVKPTSLQSNIQDIISHGYYLNGTDYTSLTLLNGNYSLVSVTNGLNVVCFTPILNQEVNTWVHLAAVYNGTSWKMYKNGALMHEIVSGAGPALAQGNWNIGGRAKENVYHYSGEIDEIRIWNTARTEMEIQDAMYNRLSGKEQGLLAYWSFDENVGAFIADATGRDHYGVMSGGVFRSGDIPPLNVCGLTDRQGNYTIPKIDYGISTTFKVTPQKDESKFLPEYKGITLSTGNPVQNEVTFTDNTSYTVMGYVQYAGTNCFAANIPIFVDGTQRTATDRSGTYKVAVSRGDHTIEPRFGDHAFSPASYQVAVTGNTAGKNFLDTKTRKITGKVGGGCNKAIGNVELTFRSENECFVQTLNLSTPTNFNIILAPQKYFVQVTNVDNVQSPLDRASILEYFTNIGARAVDLTSADTTLEFIYHAPIKVQITGLGGDTCAPLRARVLKQGPTPINLKIHVTEDYGAAGTCNVDTATVTIIDEINDVEDKPVTIGVKNGVGLYTTYANTPNTAPGRYDAMGFDRSYQKAITAIAEVVGQQPVLSTQWVVVKGRKQRQGSRFVTGFSTPVPLYVIHDPPGDGSYAYVEKGYSFCKKIDPLEAHHKNGGGLGVDIKLGFQFQKGVGFGVFLATETFFRAVLKLDIIAGNQVDREGATTICGTFQDQYATSGAENFVGEDADIFIGYGENYIFALTDVVDVENCQIKLPPPVVGFDKNGFSTTFAFTRGHIKNSVIPGLEILKRDAIRRRDSGGKDSVAFFQSFIDAWRGMLAWDSTQVANAKLSVNRSFSAGADYQYSYQADTTVAYMEKKSIWLDQSLSAGLGFGTDGNESQIVVEQMSQHEWLDELTDTSGTNTKGFGYFLSDNDDGDNFTVDVKTAANELSPVFKVKAGASSCPYEPWNDNAGKPTMTRRDLPEISLTPSAQIGIQPDQPAVFTVNLTNKSETEETRSYVLSIVDSSNRGGAIVTANGAPMYAGVPLTVPYNQTRYLTLTVERGPVFYDYSKLLLRVGPQCESDREDVSKTISLDVRFSAPCSDISLFSPSSGWLVNQSDSISTHSKLNITMKDFQVLYNGRDSIQEIGAQYRRVGDVQWLPIKSIRGSNLQEGKSASLTWDYSGITKDGEYEIRAYTKCASGNGYSSVVRGLIDRTPPEVFGAPEPSDSILTLGEEIAISFSEKIDRNSITPVSILMRKILGGIPADTIGVNAVTDGKTIIITPLASAVAMEGQRFSVLVRGIKDAQGNPMQGVREWEFTVRKNAFTWNQLFVSRELPFRSRGQITARLSNGSSRNAHYVITDKPSWLTVSQDTGTILKGNVGEIVFGIPDTLRLNTLYSGVVSVMDPDIGVSQFTVTVSISCALPDWVAPVNKYEYSMNIIDSLLIGNIPSTDTNDVVAAIIGGEVRGVAKLKYVPSVGYRIFMTVYSNNPRGERVKFRVWDASDCRLYNSTFETYRFMKDSIIGDPYRPEPLTALDAAAYDVLPISIKAGWNWFSTNVRAQDMTTTGILSDLPLSQGDIVKSIDEFAVNDGNEWSGSLVEFENTQSYMLKVKESGTIAVEGNFVDSTTSIPVRKGWNWISYLPTQTLGIDAAFANYGLALHDTDFVKTQVAFAKYVTAGSGKRWIGSLEMMEPGKGYKLYAKNILADTSFSYYSPGVLSGTTAFGDNTVSGKANQQEYAVLTNTLSDWKINPHSFESNMTVTAIVKIKNAEITTDSIFVGAFVGDECRGVVKAVYNKRYGRWYAFLMMYSNLVEEDNFKLRVFDAKRGEVWEMPDSLVFKSDGVLGAMNAPLVVNATKLIIRLGVGVEDEIPQTYRVFQNYPNPFNPSTQIKYGLPEKSHVRVKIFNTLGQYIATLVDGEETAGYKVVHFDGGKLASGLYFCRIEASSVENHERTFIEVKKMLLVK